MQESERLRDDDNELWTEIRLGSNYFSLDKKHKGEKFYTTVNIDYFGKPHNFLRGSVALVCCFQDL